VEHSRARPLAEGLASPSAAPVETVAARPEDTAFTALALWQAHEVLRHPPLRDPLTPGRCGGPGRRLAQPLQSHVALERLANLIQPRRRGRRLAHQRRSPRDADGHVLTKTGAAHGKISGSDRDL